MWLVQGKELPENWSCGGILLTLQPQWAGSYLAHFQTMINYKKGAVCEDSTFFVYQTTV